MAALTLCSSSKSTNPEILNDIRNSGCNLTIWERQNISDAETLLKGTPSDLRFSTKLAQLAERIPSELNACGFLESPTRRAIELDVKQLSERYCSLLSLSELEVRLELITTNSCRKWHSDYVTARLISTYVGQGTQWLDARDAELVKQGQEPERMNAMNAGDVGIFKGKLATDMPAIHRSPPIAGTGKTRLLLVLNPPEET